MEASRRRGTTKAQATLSMIAEKQSRLPFIFIAAIATFFVTLWSLGLLGVIEVGSPVHFVISFVIYLFFLPLALLMWKRFFNVPFAARIENGDLTFWSMGLFPRQVRIPLASVSDARLAEKEVAGETIPVLRLELSDCKEIEAIRSAFKSAPGFGFYDGHFDCALNLRVGRSDDLAAMIRQQIRMRATEPYEVINPR